MRNVAIATILSATLLFTGSLFAESGKAAFTQSGCTACHNPTKDQLSMGLGPSIKMIKDAYKGDTAKLVKFLKGQGKPVVAPEKFATMQGQIAITKTFPDSKLQAIANYLAK